MSDSESDATYISFTTISNGMDLVLDCKDKLENMFKVFSDQVNALNSYIDLYKLQECKQKRRDNDSNRSGKKKFCSNFNINNGDDNDDYECNNNNNNNNSKKSCKKYLSFTKQIKRVEKNTSKVRPSLKNIGFL
jgi:hypothetical protein